jgi:hypothetical protein
MYSVRTIPVTMSNLHASLDSHRKERQSLKRTQGDDSDSNLLVVSPRSTPPSSQKRSRRVEPPHETATIPVVSSSPLSTTTTTVSTTPAASTTVCPTTATASVSTRNKEQTTQEATSSMPHVSDALTYKIYSTSDRAKIGSPDPLYGVKFVGDASDEIDAEFKLKHLRGPVPCSFQCTRHSHTYYYCVRAYTRDGITQRTFCQSLFNEVYYW